MPQRLRCNLDARHNLAIGTHNAERDRPRVFRLDKRDLRRASLDRGRLNDDGDDWSSVRLYADARSRDLVANGALERLLTAHTDDNQPLRAGSGFVRVRAYNQQPEAACQVDRRYMHARDGLSVIAQNAELDIVRAFRHDQDIL